MIIGISGKKQHGKDTVAKIIQYLMFEKRYPNHVHTTSSFINEMPGFIDGGQDLRNTESTWYIKKFATKLKQVVCLLIGCTMEQLEDNKFKETPLGEHWKIWYWKYKEHLAKYNQRFGRIFMSEEEAIKGTFTNDSFLQVVELTSEILTPRKILQLVGTEAGRQLIHPNIWVNALMEDYKGDLKAYRRASAVRGADSMWYVPENPDIPQQYWGMQVAFPTFEWTVKPYVDTPNWIITDVRFPNELIAIEEREGVVIRVNRPNPHRTCITCGHWWFLTEKDDGKGPCPKCGSFNHAAVLHLEDEHESETALDSHKFDYTITNNGSVEELMDNIRTILLNLKLI